MKMKVQANNIIALSFLSVFYFVFRLIGLGFDVINIDYPLWDNRASNFYIYLKTFNFPETYRTGHPGVTLMWIAGGAMEIFSRIYHFFFHVQPVVNDYAVFPWRSLVIKLSLVFSIYVITLLSLFVIERLTSKRVAILFFFLLSIEPFIFAHDRIFHLDGLLTSLVFLSALLSIFFWRSKGHLSRRALYITLLSGAFSSSMAFLTKVTGVFAFLFFYFTGLFFFVVRKKFLLRRYIGYGLVYFLSFLAFFVIFFPAAWVGPINVFMKMAADALSLSVGGHNQYFLGRWTDDPGILYYLFVFAFKLSPIAILWGMASVILVLLRKKLGVKVGKSGDILVLLVSFVFLFVLEISISSKKIPRYIIPTIPAILLLVSILAINFYDSCKNLRKIFIAFAVLTFVYQGFWVYKLFPNILAYASPLLGGMRSEDYYIGNKHFGFGLKEVADYLNAKPYSKEIRLIFDGAGSIGPFFFGMARDETYIFRDSVAKCDYFLLPYYLINKDEIFLEVKSHFNLDKVFYVNDYPYWYLYKNNGK